MNTIPDSEQIVKYDVPICMDICHLLMGQSAFKFNAKELLNRLAPQIEHLHLADSSGFDGEGMLFGEGDEGNNEVIKAALEIDCVKVIEVWQGHLNSYNGFAAALTKISEM